MELVHTLLFLLRENKIKEDTEKIEKCLKSLEKGTYHTVVVYNQGFWSNEQLQDYLKSYQLNCIVIGEGINKGIVVGRQSCFKYIWKNMPSALFVSELHLDMIFTYNWEDPLVTYLKNHDEPLICSGIVSKSGILHFLNKSAKVVPNDAMNCIDDYLANLKQDTIVYGFTHPCIHNLKVLKAVGGYDTKFLTGRQAFEDDSLLLSYYYYYGTRMNWKPKVNFQSVVYHEIAGQRLELRDNEMINFLGLVKQYGAMGQLHLSRIHEDLWHIAYFSKNFYSMQKEETK